MILSDGEIKYAILNKHIVIDPEPGQSQYTSSALDLSLGDEILELKTVEELQRDEPPGVQRPFVVNLCTVNVPSLLQRYGKPLRREDDGSYILKPRHFVLGMTREYINLPKKWKIAARVEGRSTLARMGLAVHLTAPTIHADFSGHIALEMFNFGNHELRLIPGQLAICQLVFERVGKIPKKISTRYQGQRSLR